MVTLQLKHLKRYKDIAWLLMKYGRSDLVKEMGSEIDISEETREKKNMPSSEELVADLQAMGPTFVKLGQLLSSQVDWLPEGYIESLDGLQDQADPFPYEEVEKIFLSEFGFKIRDVFEEFDQTPFAAASLAQVHKAVLPSGRVVAVKVQRPGIQQSILEDLDVLDELVSVIETRSAKAKRYGLKEMVTQVRTTLLNELDYKKEERNLITFKNNVKEFRNIKVPNPVEDYTTSRILTMDYIKGQKITQLDPLIKIDIKGKNLTKTLFEAYLHQILIDGLVHVDPHPGNVYLTEDNKLVIYDLGMVTRIAPQLQNGILKLLLAISEGQGEEAADILIRLGQQQDEFVYHQFREQVSSIVSQYQDLNLSEMAIGKLILKIARISGDTGIILPPQFNMLGKALLNLDRVARALAPDFNPNEVIRQEVSELLDQRMRKNFTTGAFYRSFIEATELLQHLPTKVNNILDLLSRNEMKLTVDAFDERRLMVGFEKIANRITLGLILAALIIGAALLMRVETAFTVFGYPGIAMLCFLGAAIGGFLLILNILISDEKNVPK